MVLLHLDTRVSSCCTLFRCVTSWRNVGSAFVNWAYRQWFLTNRIAFTTVLVMRPNGTYMLRLICVKMQYACS